ncbi:glycosyltransferase family 2 protein [Kamptonema cortianum]|uniref:Glycosyltransferase family 2 protein n=1 Tax=Geitlerinema calcuttense NRMC-F 0142 TaxID=2922238 RepID=A0ABT7LYB3_9CYAN|nr:glycosyltransferase family 2 protein [Geitlerinema calcuttense]MCD8487444.1 glycosyltransferase [Desertifilum sp.]MDK3157451.1 glycosyltransferase family 2 protein [Kamptonema cortianum]MDL5056983.1 glycosyltransferase family 2 protein [Geitlerinema calcuttense NRMC-F 0142]
MGSSADIRISVALIARNRPESLNQCLASVRSQTVQPFEIVVSDDSDPEFAPQLEAIANHWQCRYLRGPRRGMQANRNHAHLACQGTHVRTMDDDHEFPPDHFEKIQKAVESDPKSVWVLAEYHEHPTAESIIHLPGELQPRGFRKPLANPDDCFAISDGAAIYPREIFNKHRFLEGLIYAGELEFGARLKALGYRIRYCPDTYIIHHCGAYHEPEIVQKSQFIGAYLTYACYFRDRWKTLECLIYFLSKALQTSLNINNSYFGLEDFWETWKLGNKYGQLFQDGKYDQMI